MYLYIYLSIYLYIYIFINNNSISFYKFSLKLHNLYYFLLHIICGSHKANLPICFFNDMTKGIEGVI